MRRSNHLITISVLLALIGVAGLSVLARIYTVLPIDVWFTRELQEIQWAFVSRLMIAVSFLGYEPWSAITAVAGSALVAALLGWRDGLYLLGVTVGQGLVNAAIKWAVGRPRPVTSLVDVIVPLNGYSFPSGHVMFYTVFFGFVAFLALTRAPPRWRWPLAAAPLALVLLVGPSRIILGAHWLSDVLAAYLLGLAILAVAIERYVRWLRRSV